MSTSLPQQPLLSLLKQLSLASLMHARLLARMDQDHSHLASPSKGLACHLLHMPFLGSSNLSLAWYTTGVLRHSGAALCQCGGVQSTVNGCR